jgi:D-alanyl-D-alanine carboxypeptidase
MFPYFDRSMLYFLIGELNKRGVTAINQLTFDENFLYASQVRKNGKLIHDDGEQTEADIVQELTSDITNIQRLYSAYLQATQPLVNIALPTTARMKIKAVGIQSLNLFDSAKASSTFMLRSSQLHRTLKELNRNSHNYATDKIFQRLSRTEKFEDYMTSIVGANISQFSFVNGSGFPKLIEETKDDVKVITKVYNSATCRTVVEVVKRLNQVATRQGKDLQYLFPVAGADAVADGNSTVTSLYLNDVTRQALFAKTGTINPSVSLAGTALTKTGPVFFHVSSSTQDYASIRTFLAELFETHGGSLPLANAATRAFVPFDEHSIQEAK